MMNVNVSPILQQSNSERKRKNQPVSYIKKFRSKIPRRKRVQISPIINESSNSLFSDKQKTEFSAFTTASSSSSCFPGEISCNSSWISVGSENLNRKQRSYSKKQRIEKIRGCGVGIRPNERSYCKPEKNSGGEFRRITRSYSKQKEIERTVEKKGNGDRGVEVSEYSCVESTSGVDAEVVYKSDEFSKRNAKQLKTRSYKGTTKATESDENVTSAVITISGISCIQPSPQEKVKNLSKLIKFNGTSKEAEMSLENEGYEVISETSCLESLSGSKNKILCPSDCISSEKTTKDDEIRASVTEFPENSRNQVELNLSVSNLESTGEQKTEDFELDSVLGCSEKLSYEDDSDYSTTQEMTFSQLESEILGQRSDLDFSDYSPLLCLESASDFSERSTGKSTPSVCFLLLLQYRNQFIESCSRPEIGVSSRIQDEYFDDFTLLRFEDEETEESYKMLRTRERSQMLLHNYIEEYYSTTEYGELDVEQRLLMVNWIIEQSDAKEFHYETVFLGVSLFDRFLSRGFFKSKRNLQLVGIACLTLATRIEEKQPNNSIQQMTFHVGRNVYSRSEVVAMEWLVQEVLNFQCCFPTVYNFLWFYLKAAKADAEVENRAKYLVVLSLLDHELLCYWPSTIAAGLVILSSLASNQDTSCQWVMETHVRTKNDDLPECIQSLEWLVKYVC